MSYLTRNFKLSPPSHSANPYVKNGHQSCPSSRSVFLTSTVMTITQSTSMHIFLSLMILLSGFNLQTINPDMILPSSLIMMTLSKLLTGYLRSITLIKTLIMISTVLPEGGVPVPVPPVLPEGAQDVTAAPTRPCRNVGTWKDGPAIHRRLPIIGDDYDYSFSSSCLNQPVAMIAHRGLTSLQPPPQRLTKHALLERALFQRPWKYEHKLHAYLQLALDEPLHIDNVTDPRIVEAHVVSSKYNDDNPSYNMAMNGPF